MTSGEQVEAALAGLGKSTRRGPGRPRGTSRRRRRGSTRADQAVKIISDNPGIKVSELGKKMKLNHPNYLYRVLPASRRKAVSETRPGLPRFIRRVAPTSNGRS